MKKCPWRGKDYPDSELLCVFDGTVLAACDSGAAGAAEGTPIPPVLPPSEPPQISPPAAFWTDRRIRILEVVLVCVIAFGTSLISSTGHFLSGRIVGGSIGTWAWANSMLHAAAVLGLVWYVLMR